MSNKNEMTSLYSELAPQFLIYLAQEMKKIDTQVNRLKGAGQDPEALESDSPVNAEVGSELVNEIEADEDLIEADLPASESAEA